MTYEELLQRKGKFVFVHLENLDTWVRCKVKTMGTIERDENKNLVDAPDMIQLEGNVKKINMRMRLDLFNQDEMSKWNIKIKPHK